MNVHEKFNFKKKEDLVEKIRGLGADIPLAENCSALFEKISIAGRTLPNRLVVNPMEGADSDGRGAPSELTFRRYRRFASGGSAVIWFEATAVRQDGRSNLRQLFLQAETVDAFKRLVECGTCSFNKDPKRISFAFFQVFDVGTYYCYFSIFNFIHGFYFCQFEFFFDCWTAEFYLHVVSADAFAFVDYAYVYGNIFKH